MGGEVSKIAKEKYEQATGNVAVVSDNAIGARYVDNDNLLS